MIEPHMRERAATPMTAAAGKLSIGSLAKATGVARGNAPDVGAALWVPGGRAEAVRAPRLRAVDCLAASADCRRDRARAPGWGGGGRHRRGAGPAALGDGVTAGARAAATEPVPASVDDLLAAVKAFDADRLTAALWSDWGRLGPIGFLERTVAPLIERVGREWEQGGMEVRHEHFLSERLGDVMRAIRLPLDLSSAGRRSSARPSRERPTPLVCRWSRCCWHRKGSACSTWAPRFRRPSSGAWRANWGAGGGDQRVGGGRWRGGEAAPDEAARRDAAPGSAAGWSRAPRAGARTS